MLILNSITISNRISFNFSAFFVFVDRILGSYALSLAPAIRLGKARQRAPGQLLIFLGRLIFFGRLGLKRLKKIGIPNKN